MTTPPTRVLTSTPAVGYGSNATPKVTPTFDVTAGDLIVVRAVTEDQGGALQTPTTTATVGAWTLRATIAVASYTAVYIWTANVTATATARTISVAEVGAVIHWSFTVTLWRAHGGVGAAPINVNAASGTPEAAITCAANSAVEFVSGDWNALTGARTWDVVNGTAMTEDTYYAGGTTYTAYGAYRADTGAAGAKTIGTSTPAAQKYALCGVEILGTTASGVTGDAAMVVTAGRTATGNVAHSTGAALAVTSAMTATGTVGTPQPRGDAALAVTAAATATGTVGRSTGAALAVTSVMSASGYVAGSSPHSGSSLVVTAAATATGTVGRQGDATRSETVTLTATGKVGLSTGGSRVTQAQLTASGFVSTGSAPAPGNPNFNIRLVAYDPDGARLGILPDPLSASVAYPFLDLSSLTVEYSKLAVNGSLLAQSLGAGREVAVEYWNGAQWIEPDASRFLLLKRTGSSTDGSQKISLTMPSYAWLFGKVRMLELGVLNADGKRPFLSATAGTILRTLIDEGKARGAIPGLTYDFTGMTDSAGIPWDKIVTIYYEPGIDLATVLSNLSAQAMCDWTLSGRMLRVFNSDTLMAADRSVGGEPVDLRIGREVVDAPDEETIEEVVSNVLILGDNGLMILKSNPEAPTPWGQFEGFIGQGGVSDPGTAITLVEGELERGGRVRSQLTRELSIIEAKWIPLRDYHPGDYALAPGVGGALERLRIRQITLTLSSEGAVGGNVVLNDRFLEAEIRRARRVNGIVGGSTADGGSGARPAPVDPGGDIRVPSTPTGLVASSTAYLDQFGVPRAVIAAMWNPVSTATDSTSIEIDRYELWGLSDVVRSEWIVLTTSTLPQASYSPVTPHSTWQVKVRVVSKSNRYSAFSLTTTLVIVDDVVSPDTPSTPVLTTRLGTITVGWDGLNSVGGLPPVDFDRLEVAADVIPIPTAVVGVLGKAGFLVLTGLGYGVPEYVRFRAWDHSGNVSGWSAVATTATTQLVGADVPDNVIAARMMMANSILADSIAAGAITAVKLTADAIDGKVINGATIIGGVIETSAALGARVVMDAAGIRLYDASNAVEVNLPTGPQDATFAGTVYATGLTVKDNLHVNGLKNEFSTASVTKLAISVTAPAAAPVVTIDYDNVLAVLDRITGGGILTGGEYVHPVNLGYGVYGLRSYTAAGAAGSVSITLPNSDDQAVAGVTKVGAYYYAMRTHYHDYTNWWVDKYDSTGALIASFDPSVPQTEPGLTYINDGAPAIGTDGTNLFIAACTSTTVFIKTFTTAGSLLSTYTAAHAVGKGLTAVLTGSFDYGATRWIVATNTGFIYTYTLSGSTLTLQTNETFTHPYAEYNNGLFWNGTNFVSSSGSSFAGAFLSGYPLVHRIVQLTSNTWTTESNVWWASYSWYQRAGAYTTDQGPRTAFTMSKRARLTLHSDPIPGGTPAPDAVEFFVGRGAADPGRAAMWCSTGVPAAGAVSAQYLTTLFSGVNPPAASNFPIGTAASLQSSALRVDGITPKWSLAGDGVASFNDLLIAGYGYRRPRIWDWSRGAGTDSFGAASWVALIANTVAAAPPGDYEFSFTCYIAANAANYGYFRAVAGGMNLQDPSTFFRAEWSAYTYSIAIPNWPGGDLPFYVQVYISAGTGGQVQNPPTHATIKYLGPR